MLETEAQLRWCPFAKDSEEHYGTYNRTGGGKVQRRDPQSGVFLYETDEHGVPLRSKPLYDLVPVSFPPSCVCLTTRCMAWSSTKPGEGFCRRLVMTAAQTLGTGLHNSQRLASAPPATE